MRGNRPENIVDTRTAQRDLKRLEMCLQRSPGVRLIEVGKSNCSSKGYVVESLSLTKNDATLHPLALLGGFRS